VSLRRRLRRLLVVVLAAYALLVLAAFLFQRRLVYFPERLGGEPRLDVDFPSQVVTFASSDGVRVSGLFAPPKDDASPVLLLAHGNAGSIRSWYPLLGLYARHGLGGLLLDPRGYGWSEGSPSEDGWLRDGEAALGWLRAQGILPERVVLHGVSIGSGIVVPLAAKHPVRGLVLECPFSSLCDVAQETYPFLPCRWLLRDRYDNVAAAPGVRCPVLLVYGGRDEIVSERHSRRLVEAFETPTTVARAEDFGHDDLPTWPPYEATVLDFVSRIGRP
jgi:pimeloyl-ACP methyl ester carboxylesterase